MRKLLYLGFVVCLVLSLIGCGGRTVDNEEEMLEIITTELDSDVSVQKIGTIDLDDVVLVCYMTGNNYQEHTYGYAEFEKQNDNYKFLRTNSMWERGMNLGSALYNGSYLFVINNENCTNLRISLTNGNEELIAVDEIPFVFYLENAVNHNFEYHFLDINGKEIRP
ncbi:MAG: hypothetical protein RBS96_04040 [Dehalococcoidales bacterium]|jgi:hypothetical protein|nr:hypothetical protein [Dehalococcoidales bacterium]